MKDIAGHVEKIKQDVGVKSSFLLCDSKHNSGFPIFHALCQPLPPNLDSTMTEAKATFSQGRCL